MIECKTIDGRVVKLHPIDYREQLALGHIAEGPDITITPPKKKEEKAHSVVVKPSTKPEDIPDVRLEPSGDTKILSPGMENAPSDQDQVEEQPAVVEEQPAPVVEKKKVIHRVGKKRKAE